MRNFWIAGFVLVFVCVGCGGGTEPGDVTTDDDTGRDAAVVADSVSDDDGMDDTGRDVIIVDVAVSDVADAANQPETAVDVSIDVSPDAVVDVEQPPALTGIHIEPNRIKIKSGEEAQARAFGTYDDESVAELTTEVNWNIVDFEIATVSNTSGRQGIVTGIHEGITRLTARIGELDAGIDVVVEPPEFESLAILPAERSFPKWTSLQLQAIATYSDDSTMDISWSCQWSSENQGVAIFQMGDVPGNLTGVDVGNAKITASESMLGALAEADFEVTEAELESITINPADASLPLGSKVVFAALGHFQGGVITPLTSGVLWESSNPDAATVSNAPGTIGEVTAVAGGESIISATSGVIRGETAVTVTEAVLESFRITPHPHTIRDGDTYRFKAEVVYTDDSIVDVTEQATWSCSSTGIATVSNTAGQKGLATGEGFGTAYIKAEFGGLTFYATLYVKKSRGSQCYADDECLNNLCEKPSTYAPYGFCCDTTCPDNNGCQHCAWGDCRTVEAGTDPVGQCDNYYCDGTGHCGSSCTDEGFNCSSKCKNAWCWAGECLDKMGPGNSCVGNCQCNSNLCLFFFCT